MTRRHAQWLIVIKRLANPKQTTNAESSNPAPTPTSTPRTNPVQPRPTPSANETLTRIEQAQEQRGIERPVMPMHDLTRT
ncbi:MAG: hypothetical protein QOJ04_3395 [Caballeronia sp.]|nr:hypothetical protein [Caballeronia sp.]